MKKALFYSLFSLVICNTHSVAQDTLPDFSLRNVGGNRIIAGWTNPFNNIKQISIQRSKDSLTGYKTIMTVPDPTPVQNGYADTRAPHDSMFYRIYIMLEKGQFYFSKPRRPVKDTIAIAVVTDNPKVEADTIRIGDTFVIAKPFRVDIDKFPGTDTVAVPKVDKNKKVPNGFLPSLYVYTNRDGYVRVNLPVSDKINQFSIKFYEENGNFLFELKNILEREFKIDKSAFYHAGWFFFELYDGGKLLEKHKFYLEKEF